MPRQTTLELKPDQIQPGESTINSSIPSPIAENADEEPRPSTISTPELNHDNEKDSPPRALDSFSWEPEFDHSPYANRLLKQMDAEDLEDDETPPEEVKSEDPSSQVEWKPEYDNNLFIAGVLDAEERRENDFEMAKTKHNQMEKLTFKAANASKKKSVRFADDSGSTGSEHEETVGTNNEETALKNFPDWLSNYDKSEMMVDSDYQEEVGDSSDSDMRSQTSDCTEHHLRALDRETLTEQIKEEQNIEPSNSEERKAPGDTEPGNDFQRAHLFGKSLGETENRGDSEEKVDESMKTKSESADAEMEQKIDQPEPEPDKADGLSKPPGIEPEKFVRKHGVNWDNRSGSNCSFNANALLDKDSVEPGFDKETQSWTSETGTETESTEGDEDYDPDEEERKSIEKAKEWLQKEPKEERDRSRTPSDFDASSSSDCSENAEAMLKQHEKTEESVNGLDNPAMPAMNNGNPGLSLLPPPAQTFDSDSSSDCTENADAVIEQEEKRNKAVQSDIGPPIIGDRFDSSTDSEVDGVNDEEVEEARDEDELKATMDARVENKYDSSTDSEVEREKIPPSTDDKKEVSESEEQFSDSSTEEETPEQVKKRKVEEMANKLREEEHEAWLQSMGRMRFKSVRTTLVKVEKEPEPEREPALSALDKETFDPSTEDDDDEVAAGSDTGVESGTSTLGKIAIKPVLSDLGAVSQDVTEEANAILDQAEKQEGYTPGLTMTSSGETWRRDLTEEMNRMMDEEERLGSPRPESPGFPFKTRPPEKSPRELLQKKMSDRVEEEMRKAESPKDEEGGIPGAPKLPRHRFFSPPPDESTEESDSGSDEDSFVVLPNRARGGFPIDETSGPPRANTGLSKEEIQEKADIEASEKERILQRAKSELETTSSREAEKKAEEVKKEAERVLKGIEQMVKKTTDRGQDEDDGDNFFCDEPVETSESTESESDSDPDNADWATDDEADKKKDLAEEEPIEVEAEIYETGSQDEEQAEDVIRHQPEPDLMDRLNRLLGRTMDEIKSADDALEEHKHRMEKAEEVISPRKDDEKEVNVRAGKQAFFDAVLETSAKEEEEMNAERYEDEDFCDEQDEQAVDRIDKNGSDNERREAGYISDTEDEPQFTPGRNDYSFSESGEESARRLAEERDKEDEGLEEQLEARKQELPLSRNRDKEDDDERDQDRYEYVHSSSSSSSSSSSESSEEDQEDDNTKQRAHYRRRSPSPEEKQRPVYDREAGSSSETPSSDFSSSAWSEDETPKVPRNSVVDFEKAVQVEKDVRTRAWADEQKDPGLAEKEAIVVPDANADLETIESARYKNLGSSSDSFTQPLKPRPPAKQRPSSATLAVNRQIGGRRIRPMSAQSSSSQEQIPLRQYRLDFSYTTERSRPRGRRVSGTLYKHEPLDNDSRLRQKFDELLELVEGDPMPILVGPPTKAGKFSPRIPKSPRERSRSDESEKKKSPRPKKNSKPKEAEEDVDMEKLSKELDEKYKELEKVMCKVGKGSDQSHRLVQKQFHQAILMMQQNKPKVDPSSKMEGYQYNLPPRPHTGIPDRDDPRSRSFSPTDHNLRNSDNPVVRDWLKHKERCLRIQRAEERVKRKEEKKKEKIDVSEKEEKYKESTERVDDWMKKKRKEGRRLLKYRNNKENFVNLNRPSSARPEVMMTTTSLEFKRPSSASISRGSTELPPRPKSSKPKVAKKEEPVENGTAGLSEKEKRRISYEQWLQTKRREDEARKLDEKRTLEEMRSSYQDSELDKIIPELARNRIRVIESNKKRVDTGVKKIDDEANSYPRQRPSSGTKGVKMYRWRPASAQPSTSAEESGNKYQLVRPGHNAEFGPSPYRLSTDPSHSSKPKANTQRPSSAKNRTKYAEHVWTNFSDNVWKQVNNDNGARPMERPEPMGQAEPSAPPVSEDKGFHIEGHGTVKPLSSAGESQTTKGGADNKPSTATPSTLITNGVRAEPVIVNHVAPQQLKAETTKQEKPKTFLETIAGDAKPEPAKQNVQKPVVEEKPKESQTHAENKTHVVKATPPQEKKVTIVNEKAEIEPVPVPQSASPIKLTPEPEVKFEKPKVFPKPEPKVEPVSSTSSPPAPEIPQPSSPPQETVILTEDGTFIGTEPRRRGSILKVRDVNGIYHDATPKKKKKNVTFGEVQMSDGGERSTSSDSDVDRVPITAYRGVRYNDLAQVGGLSPNNFFLTDLNDS